MPLRRWSARRSPGGVTRCSSSRRSCRATPPRGHGGGLRASLARLRTDRLDCYLLHWRGRHPLEDTFAAFEQLRPRKDPLLGREQFRRVRPRSGLGVAGAGPPRLQPGPLPFGGARDRARRAPMVREPRHRRGRLQPIWSRRLPRPRHRRRSRAGGDRGGHGATPRQVALRFLVRRPSLFAIPKASSPDHTAENAGAGQLHLTEADLARIDKAFPRDPKPRRLPML